MEWLVPILFVLVSLAQWWMKRRQAASPTPSPSPEHSETEKPGDPLDEFGDLLEALGRRRHETPPPPPKIEKTPPPRILPPLESTPAMGDPSFGMAFTPQPALPSPIQPPEQQANFRKTMKDPYSVQSLFRRSSTDWSKAIILSEVLAPPVALR